MEKLINGEERAFDQFDFKKGKSTEKSWSFNDPEFQRKKRVASYKVYAVEGKVKGSFRKSFRWKTMGLPTEVSDTLEKVPKGHYKTCMEERFKEMVSGKGFEDFDRESTLNLRHLPESNISEIPDLEDEYRSNIQLAVSVIHQLAESVKQLTESVTAAVLPPPAPESQVRTNMNQLLTFVGGIAIALYSGLMTVTKNFSRADASPQQLHMQNVIVICSTVLIAVCCASGIALWLVFQKITTYHPCKSLPVRVLRMNFFLTAFFSSFLLLSGLFIPPKHLWALIFVTVYVYLCGLLASAFHGIPPEHDSSAPTNNHA